MDKWISVKDGLPEYGDEVIIASESGVTCDNTYCNGKDAIGKDIVQWSLTTEELVTHWMPFPKPPK